jgi:hypothetical protein
MQKENLIGNPIVQEFGHMYIKLTRLVPLSCVSPETKDIEKRPCPWTLK